MRKFLNFNEDFMEKIKRGEKRATLRLGIKDFKEGEDVIIKCGDRTIGRAVIKEVHHKKFDELTDEDIRMDGYKKREDLKRDLERFYGHFSEDDVFTQIIFDLSEIY